MKFQNTILLFNETLPTKYLLAVMSQLAQITQRYFKNVVQLSTESISSLTFFKSLPKFSFCILLVALITVIPYAPGFAANVSVTWNKNSESDLAGYKIYKRTLPSQDFGQPIFSGMPSNPSSPATTVSGLNGGTTYGFIATAFDKSGNESAPSTEKQITLTTTSPPPPSSTLSISNLTAASGRAYVVPTTGLQAGGTVYIDRAYTFTTVPSLVQGAAYIRTANNDKAATNTAFLSFMVNQPVAVYVGYDVRITPKPSWLNTFTDTGTNLVTSDSTFRLFVRSFPAGTISLGGNASSVGSMYSVVVKSEGGTPADTTPPTVTLTAPNAGTVSGTVTVSASASDNTGVAGVQFRRQGANLGAEDTTNPYSTTWNTTTVPNGSYTLTAIARDAAGNTTTSASRTVTVSNTTTPSPPPPTSTLSISNLTVSNGKTYVLPTSGLQTGNTVYIDRSYTFMTVPSLVQGAAYIRTANNDKAGTNATFLSFTVNQPVAVYVAHDVRITTKPSWLTTFTDTGTNLVTADTTLRLFVRSFPTGTITLGGNASSGNSMYSVIVKP